MSGESKKFRRLPSSVQIKLMSNVLKGLVKMILQILPTRFILTWSTAPAPLVAKCYNSYVRHINILCICQKMSTASGHIDKKQPNKQPWEK